MSIEISYECIKTKHQWSTCRACADTCPTAAVTLTNSGAKILQHKCSECGLCVIACPVGAIDGQPPLRRLDATVLYSEDSPVPTLKELLLFYADGIRTIIVRLEQSQWLSVILKTNAVLEEMGLEPLTLRRGAEVPAEQISASRRSFLRLGQVITGGVKSKTLSTAYPTYQFFDVAINTDTCGLCRACAGVCPEKCIAFGPDDIQIEQYRCTGCALCRDGCVSQSIAVTCKVRNISPKSYGIVKRQCITCKETYFVFDGNDATSTAGQCQACLFRERIGIPSHTIGQHNLDD